MFFVPYIFRQVAIHPNFAANPSSSLDTVNFLLEDEILCEWINFGLKDENPEVIYYFWLHNLKLTC